MKTSTLALAGCVLGELLTVAVEANAQEATGPAVAVPAPAFKPVMLVKTGIAPTRCVPQYRYNDLRLRLSPSIGLERQITPTVTLYALAEADFLPRRASYYWGEREALVHTGAVGVGGRYYYNQAGRAQHQRVHGPFVGNYVALEALTELDRKLFTGLDGNGNSTTAYNVQAMPLLNAYWGLQRRPGKHFLYDLNTGVGIIARPVDKSFYALDRPQQYRLQGNFAINLRVYYVR